LCRRAACSDETCRDHTCNDDMSCFAGHAFPPTFLPRRYGPAFLREGVATADLASSAIPLRAAPAQQLQLLPRPHLLTRAGANWKVHGSCAISSLQPRLRLLTSMPFTPSACRARATRRSPICTISAQGRAPTGRCMADIVATVAPTSPGFRHLGRFLPVIRYWALRPTTSSHDGNCIWSPQISRCQTWMDHRRQEDRRGRSADHRERSRRDRSAHLLEWRSLGLQPGWDER
jgi:hypothetical protein